MSDKSLLSVIYWTASVCLLCCCSAEKGCPNGLPDTTLMTSHKGTCYQYVNDASTWWTASAYCLNHGGNLVTLNDEETNDFVTDKLSRITSWTNNGVWIGLNDDEEDHHWEWVTATSGHSIRMTWSNWGKGQPLTGLASTFKGDCVHMRRSKHWKWYEGSCFSFLRTYKFICQYEQEIQTTTVQPNLETTETDISTESIKILDHEIDEVTTHPTVNNGAGFIEKMKKNSIFLLAIILSVLIAVIFIVVYLIRRCKCKKHEYKSPPYYNDESIYEDILSVDSASALVKCNTESATQQSILLMQTSVISEGRMSNVYVEPDGHFTKAGGDVTCQKYDTDGYMEPKSLLFAGDNSNFEAEDPYLKPEDSRTQPEVRLSQPKANVMTDSQLTDIYLTVTPLPSPTKPTAHNALTVTYVNSQACRELPNLPDDYMPMNKLQRT